MRIHESRSRIIAIAEGPVVPSSRCFAVADFNMVFASHRTPVVCPPSPRPRLSSLSLSSLSPVSSLLSAHHPVTSAEVDIRSPRFDVGYVIRRSEYAPSGSRSKKKTRAGCRAGRSAGVEGRGGGAQQREGGGGYSNGPTLVWKCARCKDDGGIRQVPSRGYYQSLARQASHDNARPCGRPP